MRQAIALRRGHASLRRETFFSNAAHTGPEVVWLSPAGVPLTEQDWHDAGARAFAMHLSAQGNDGPLAILFNGSADPVTFHLPASERWQLAITSGDAATPMTLAPGSAAVFETVRRS